MLTSHVDCSIKDIIHACVCIPSLIRDPVIGKPIVENNFTVKINCSLEMLVPGMITGPLQVMVL